ncbi:molybdenum cofactor sulfurase [Ambystoma mexicanum]|uniref:molybdenum cofactor sulfurase n=1 Tax=Ambystoma mexicanum TaxID=8296 RepID=UPI0037E88D8A
MQTPWRARNVPKAADELLSFRHFQEQPRSAGYGYGGRITDIRREEFSRIGDMTYLDNVGTTLFAHSMVENFTKDITGSVYGNPHSQNVSSKLTHDTIEHVRYRILQHFNTTPDDYTVIFTSGCTAAIKLVAESFPWTPTHSEDPASCLCYLTDNHTSVIGMRRATATTNVMAVALTPEKIAHLEKTPAPPQETYCPTAHLFCYPAQSNFSGHKYPLSWIQKVKDGSLRLSSGLGKWYVLLDAAAYVSTSPLDLAAHPADFVPLSFYKVFGFPTGLGALLVSNKIAPLLRKHYFGGGTIAFYLTNEGVYVPKESVSERFEDGTCSFLDIIALKHGFDALERLTGGMKNIREHTFALACYTYTVLSALRYDNGLPVARIYCKTGFKSWDVQGPVISFNILDENGDIIGYSQVDKLAALHNIHVRTGCFCNAGACQLYLGISDADLKTNFEGGHICGDAMDMIDGRTTGCIRASFGYMSTFEDAQAFLRFITDTFAERPTRLALHGGCSTTREGVVPDSLQSQPLRWSAPGDHMDGTNLMKEPLSTKNVCHDYSSMNGKANGLHPEQRSATLAAATRNGAVPITLTHIFLYPIKSCAAMEVSEWPIGKQGLLYDRSWMVVNQNGVCLSQKQESKLCMIHPSIDLAREKLIIRAKDMESIEIPLLEEKGTENRINQNKVCGDRVQTYDCGDKVSKWLSTFLDRRCRLIRQNLDYNRNANKREKKGSTGATLSLVNEAQYLLIHTASILSLQQNISPGNEKELEEHFPLSDMIPRFRANFVIHGGRAFEEEDWSVLSVGSLRFQVLRKCTRCQIICIDQQTGEVRDELLRVLAASKGGKTTFGMYLQNQNLGSSRPAVLSVGDKVFPELKADEESLCAPTSGLQLLDVETRWKNA